MGELGKYRRLSKDYEALPETSVESIGAPSLLIIFLISRFCQARPDGAPALSSPSS
jgi:hypothetical protein